MPAEMSKADTYIDHERPVAERYRWWGVYLIREKRRLQGIAEAVQAEEAAAALRAQTAPLPESQAADEVMTMPGLEMPDELLTRLDAEMETAGVLAEIEEVETTGEVRESQRQRRTGVLLGRPKDSRDIEED